MPNWTKEQLDAISDRGHSLIVCAAAGSGKTAVLVERIVSLVREGCPIDSMLVVTFTNAAASEMRQRIGAALSAACQTQPELAGQLTALGRASISTLHRFCGSLLREHFAVTGIDPAFRIADEQECAVLSRQAMEDALYACYDVGSEAFMAADAFFTQEELAAAALDVRRFMMTRPDPQAWLARARGMLGMDGDALAGSEAVALLLSDAKDRLSALEEDARATLSLCRAEQGPLHYADACAQDIALLGSLAQACDSGYAALHAALSDVAYAPLGRKKKGDLFDESIADAVKKRRKSLKDGVEKISALFSLSPQDAAADLAMTRAPLDGLCELVKTYDALYEALKRRRGVMDFDDLEHGALRALAHDEVADALREKYRFVFIDEYQDSSSIQEAIISRFAREDGVFLVGDVKQSIYRFRQAEPALFLDKAARYDREDEPLCRRIDLQRNFRSRANVLNGVNAVFERIMRADTTEIEYDEREALIPGLDTREDDPPLELHLIYKPDGDVSPEETQEDDAQEDDAQEDGESAQDERDLKSIERETLIAAGRIHELIGTPFYDAKSGGERPLRYRDIAVLMRAARGSAPLAADVLKSEGIPVFCDAGEGYFDIPEVRAMMALLETIDNGAHDSALLAALRGPALGLSDGELAAIRIHTPDAKTPYHEAVRRYREEMDDALAGRLRAFDERLARWRLIARHQGVDRLIEMIYAETDFLAQAGALSGGASRQANLHLLTARARSFMQMQGGSLHAFLRYAQKLRAGGDSMTASAIGEDEDVVRIMTTHKSKGLEFPVVFVLGMGRRLRTASADERVITDAQLGIGLPCVDTQLGSERDTVLRRAMRIKSAREQLSEEIRILYVAMTRARERLILIGDTGSVMKPGLYNRIDSAASIRGISSGLDMVAPVLAAAGASMTIREEAVCAGPSRWHVFAHQAGSAAALSRRTQEGVMQMLARLENTPVTDDALARVLFFSPRAQQAAPRKMSVSSVLRDEKRAAEDELHCRETELIRLPRFMLEQKMTGAQIGTAFHRMMRMLSLDALRAAPRLEEEIAAQREAMLADGVVTRAEYDAVPVRLLLDFFTQPLGVRLLASPRVQREWAFTWKQTAQDGQARLLQGIIDCCFMEDGQWILVDYKTDSAADAAAAIERHRPQLSLYAMALEAITGIPVRERVLYLVRAARGFCV